MIAVIRHLLRGSPVIVVSALLNLSFGANTWQFWAWLAVFMVALLAREVEMEFA